jgi:hypothetical protein
MPKIIIHRPDISEEERARRIEEIKKAMIEVKKEMIRNAQKLNQDINQEYAARRMA